MDNYYDVNKICRTCLTETDDMKIIFEVTISEDQNIKITDFIRRLTSLKITKCDDLPNKICIYCIEELCKAFQFAQMCIVTDSKLKLNTKQQGEAPHEIETDLTNNDPVDEFMEDESPSEIKYCEEFLILKSEPDNVQQQHKFKCKLCPESFNSEKSLAMHERIHNPTISHKCEVCQKTFPKAKQLKVHSRSHIKNEDKQFTCSECGQKFRYLYLLEKHSYKHQEEKPFPCEKCDKGCITAESLKRHMRIHDENYVRPSHTCTICSKEFPYQSFLAEHMKNHTGERPFLCSICGKGFRQSGTLHYHIKSHTGIRPFICKVCNGCFISPGVLRVHMRRHTNERPYVCDICGMAFRQSTDMKNHKRTHTGDKPVLCTICGKRLSTTGQLTIHVRSHTGEKPYACQVCSRAFTTKTSLVKHQRIHTGERPYLCKICGKTFNQSSTLKTHMNVHKIGQKSEAQNVNYCVLREDFVDSKTDVVLPPPPVPTIMQN